MRLFYNLSDPAMEYTLYEIESMQHFAGLKLDRGQGETTILNFRYFLVQIGLGKALFKEVAEHLDKNGLLLREGSIVDATIISASSSTKNTTAKRNRIVGTLEMRQTSKGNEWHFGMKMRIGVDETLGLIHSVDTTATNVHDIVPAGNLVHGNEQRVLGDAGYLGIQKRNEHKDRKNVSWFIANCSGSRKKLGGRKLKAEKLKAEKLKAVPEPGWNNHSSASSKSLAIAKSTI